MEQREHTELESGEPEAAPARPATGRKLRGCLGCAFKGPLGCLFFLIGALGALVLLGPFLVGRFGPRYVEEAFNEATAGSVEIDRLSLSWGARQELANLILRDPAGGRVLTANVSLPSLLDLGRAGWAAGPQGDPGRASLGRTRIELDLDLVMEADGRTNLEKALEAKWPSDPGPRRGGGTGGDFELGSLPRAEVEVAVRRLRWRDERAGAPPEVFEVEDFELRLESLAGGALRVRGQGRWVNPSRGRAELRLDLEPRGRGADLVGVGTFDGLPLGHLDALADLGGALVAALGEEGRMGIQFEAALAGLSPEQVMELPTRARVSFALAGDVGDIDLRLDLDGERLALSEPAKVKLGAPAGWLPDWLARLAEQAADALESAEEPAPEAGPIWPAELSLTAGEPFALEVERLVLPRGPLAEVLAEVLAAQAEGAPGAAAGETQSVPDLAALLPPLVEALDLGWTAVLPGLAWFDGETGVELLIFEPKASGRLTPGGPVTLETTARVGAPGGGAARALLTLGPPAGWLPGLLAEEPEVPPIDVEATLKEFPTALADRMLQTDGLLGDVLGAVVEASLVGRGLAPPDGGELGFELRSDLARATGRVRLEQGLMVPVDGEPVDLRFALTPLSSPRLVGSLVPLVGNVAPTEADQRAALTLRGFRLPLDGDLARLSGELVLDLGEVGVSLVPALAEKLSGWLPGERRARMGPYRLAVENGRVRYEGLRLSIDGRSLSFDGTLDLAAGGLSLATKVPLAQFSGRFGPVVEQVRARLSPDLAVPLEVRGSRERPSVRVGDGIEGVLEKAARDLLEDEARRGARGLLDRLRDR